jgi:drug/metabolite transporter (DMT)-like permease
VVFYRAMGDGPMSVVAPITALLTAVVPVMAGIALGERPSATAWLGVVMALIAIALVTRAPAPSAAGSASSIRGTVMRALVAGTMFGLAFVAFSRPGDAAGLWPLLGARLASLPVLALLVIATGTGFAIPVSVRRLVVVAGLLDMMANIFVIEAFARGLLTLVSVITALYPATTLILARVVLEERVRRDQMVGLGVAAGAVVLVSL